MKKITKLLTVSFISVLLIGFNVNAEEAYDYTLLIYMNGSDLESDYYAGTDDFLEMIAGDIPDNVAVIIQTGGTKDWHTDEYGLPEISSRVNQRWQVTDDNLVLLENAGKNNMGASDTLTDFINYGVTNFESDQYSLIMWNHGAGAIYGYGADELFGYDSMDLGEMQIAFENAYASHNTRFELIGFDACLMGSVEVGHVLAPYSDYLLASEELEPGHGWDYEALMNQLSFNQNSSAISFGSAIIDGFVKQAQQQNTDEAITLSLVDLSKIDEVVTALDMLLVNLQASILTGDSAGESVLRARLEAESYGEGSASIPDSDMVDIIHYASLLRDVYPVQAGRLISAVEAAVVKNINSDLKPNASGMSMYIPAKDKDTMPTAGATIAKIGMSTVIEDFIQTVVDVILNNTGTINIDTSTTTVDDSTSSSVEINIENNSIEGDDQYFYFQMDKNDLSSVSEIFTVMGMIDGDNDIQYLAKDLVDDDGISDNGQVVGETIDYWVQINGYNVAMYYESHDESGVMTYYIPIMLNDEDADLIVLFSDEHTKGEILGARKINSDHSNITNRSLIELKPNDIIDFVYEYDMYDSYEDNYYYDGWYFLDQITVGAGIDFAWEPLAIGEYVYCFEVVDVYGNLTYTDWLSYDYYSAATESGIVDDTIWDNLQDNIVLLSNTAPVSLDMPWLYEGIEPPSNWAVPHINTAYNNSLLTENTLDHYKDNITREVFCELVVNMYENITNKTVAISNPNVFSDTKNIEIVKAEQLGIVTGYGDGTFGPNDLIKREQLIAMFYRTLLLLDETLDDAEYPMLTFDDAESVSSWAKNAAKLLVNYELINGVGGNLLAPKNKATVEQSIKLVNGVYEFYISDILF